MNTALYHIRERVREGVATKEEKEWLKKNYYGAPENKNLKRLYI